MSYSYWVGERYYLSAEMQFVYFTAPADWAKVSFKTKYTRVQQFFCVVAYTEKWAIDQQTLLKLYRSLIHSQI